jgi:RimJ/RimL family protein N-acetyltransferase
MSLVTELSDGIVRLDGFTLADVEAHLAGEDEEMARRFGWWPRHSTVETVTAAIRRWAEQWATAGSTRTFAVREIATSRLVGHCELRLREDAVAHGSYSIAHHARGHGYAARAIGLACEWAFRELAVARVELYIEPDNLASREVARRAGFLEEGLLRSRGLIGNRRADMVLYSKLPGDLRGSFGSSA